jgi:hypothetical protein
MAEETTYLKIGLDNNLDPYQIELAPLTRGLVVIGQSGSGKSFLIGRLLEELILSTSEKTQILVLDTNSDFCKGLELKSLEQFKKILIKYYSNTVDANYKKFSRSELKVFRSLNSELESCQHFNRSNRLNLPTDEILEDFDVFQKIIKSNSYSNDYFWAFQALHYLRNTQNFNGLKDVISALVEIIALKEKHKTTGFKKINEKKINADFRLKLTSTSALRELLDDIIHLPIEHWKNKSGEIGICDSIFTKSRVNIVDIEMIKNPFDKKMLAIILLDKIFNEARSALVEARDNLGKDPNPIDNLKHTFIFIDEVQNFAPLHPQKPQEVLLGEIIHQIAAEGRKYGLHLVMGTQRPNKVKQGLLGECDNAIIMKMNSRSDLEKLSSEMRILDVKLLENSIYFQGTGNAFAVGEMTGIAPFTKLFKSAPRRTLEGGIDIKGF